MKATLKFLSKHQATLFTVAWGRFSLTGHVMSKTQLDGSVNVTVHEIDDSKRQWIDNYVKTLNAG